MFHLSVEFSKSWRQVKARTSSIQLSMLSKRWLTQGRKLLWSWPTGSDDSDGILRTSATTPISRLASTWGTRPSWKISWKEKTQDPVQSDGYSDIPTDPQKKGCVFSVHEIDILRPQNDPPWPWHPCGSSLCPDLPRRPQLCGLLVLAAAGLSSGGPSTSAETDVPMGFCGSRWRSIYGGCFRDSAGLIAGKSWDYHGCVFLPNRFLLKQLFFLIGEHWRIIDPSPKRELLPSNSPYTPNRGLKMGDSQGRAVDFKIFHVPSEEPSFKTIHWGFSKSSSHVCSYHSSKTDLPNHIPFSISYPPYESRFHLYPHQKKHLSPWSPDVHRHGPILRDAQRMCWVSLTSAEREMPSGGVGGCFVGGGFWAIWRLNIMKWWYSIAIVLFHSYYSDIP